MMDMVEPPRLRVQFDARENQIPIVFEKHCSEDYKLEVIPPKKEKDPKPGPIRRPTFRILNASGELVAFFNPHGAAECYKEEFKPFFDRMKQEIEKAAKEALEEFLGH
ncbi:MAG: hypothetical protein GF308_00365 [Candidatus Heimdallarchaeota archaeon]|nr:hypothetical protein [Candidatus Heimdallarchaeota archaeon]